MKKSFRGGKDLKDLFVLKICTPLVKFPNLQERKKGRHFLRITFKRYDGTLTADFIKRFDKFY